MSASPLWMHALKRYGAERPAVDTAASVVRLIMHLAEDASVEDDMRACLRCPDLAKRRATLCDVCAQDRFARPARRRT